jgi:bisphosphoglycerate-dependent phosphoglycerate mutase family 1
LTLVACWRPIHQFNVLERTLPYWNDVIVPQLRANKKILIAAHGNSLRGIVKHLDNMTDEEIMGCNLPTGIPFVYELNEDLKVGNLLHTNIFRQIIFPQFC